MQNFDDGDDFDEYEYLIGDMRPLPGDLVKRDHPNFNLTDVERTHIGIVLAVVPPGSVKNQEYLAVNMWVVWWFGGRYEILPDHRVKTLI